MKYAVSVDLGGTNLRVALGDTKGRIIARLHERSEKCAGPLGISRQIIRMTQSLVPVSKISYVGIGSAGPLNLGKGSIVHSPHLTFDRIPIVEPLRRIMKVPVYLANDCVAAVVAEKEFGQGKSYSNLVYVTISSGIGAGVFVDNNLLIGKDGNAHEVGHMTIDHHLRKLRCGCGKRGHWEAYCGGKNIAKFARFQIESRFRPKTRESLLFKTCGGDLTRLSSKDLFESAKKGDKLALEILEEIGMINAMGFANITAVYDPELITVGGAIVFANANLILKPIKRLVRQYSLNRIPKIVTTQLGEDIVLQGAFALPKYSRHD